MTPPPPPKPKAIKYLSNKELLAEIARCKNSFCEFLEPQYSSYDLIVNDLSDVTQVMIDEYLLKYNAKLDSDDHKQTDGLVVRLMTYEHIPLDLERKRKSKEANQFHAKTNFPPFKHMLLKAEDGFSFTEVGRSHWEGGFQNGHFSPEKGRMSERLGRMFMMLVQKYGRRGNWRAYCVDSETEALTKRGWLRHDQITEDDEVISLNGGKLTWSPIGSIYRNPDYDGVMHRMTVAGFDALVTPNHKFVTDSGIKAVEDLKQKDRIILTGAPVQDYKKVHSDELVEIVGWFLTEGNYYDEEGRNYTRVSIFQNEGKHADSIRRCLRVLSEGFGESRARKCIQFTLRRDACEQIMAVAPKKQLTPQFLLELTTEQRELLFQTMVKGDGWDRQNGTCSFAQKCTDRMDSFAMLVAMTGRRTAVKNVAAESFGKPVTYQLANVLSHSASVAQVENIDFHGGKVDGRTGKQNTPTQPYKGMVWCVQTLYGSFMVRRNGYTYQTGNSYNDEMCASALTQLSRVGLQFDESKSQNPFAFYTTTITHVFTRTLNLEKRNQSIRDDLLIHYGMSPSHTRQVENELNKNGSIEPKPLPSKRGRKTAAQRSAEKEAEKPINE